MTAPNLNNELLTHLASRHLHPTPTWLATFISTTRPNTPLPALKSTALFRLLATDITTSLSLQNQPPHTIFPRDIQSGKCQSRYVTGPIVCQVLDIEDIGHSRWSQVESIEAKERGETTKGREIVRVVPGDEQGQTQAQAAPAGSHSKGPFKLLVQDAKGVKAFALDLNGVAGISTGMMLGLKLVLRNMDVRRGVILLESGNVQVLGGKIEALDKAWKDGRKQRLMTAAGAVSGDGGE